MEWNWRFATIAGVIVAFGFGFFAAGYYYSEKPATTEWGRAYMVSEVTGMDVKNPMGEEFGRIDDYVIDTNGRIPFSILSFGEKSVAVPFGALKYDQEGKHLVLDFSRDRLDSAPAFDKSALHDRAWAEETYRFFGQAPYWTE